MDPSTVRALGIVGDSLTLLGSITLAIETLLRPRTARRNQASLETAKALESSDLHLVDRSGRPINRKLLEFLEAVLARWLAVIGVALLVAGFSFLLAIRICGA